MKKATEESKVAAVRKERLVRAVKKIFNVPNGLYPVDQAALFLRMYFGCEPCDPQELSNKEIVEVLQAAGVRRVKENGVAYYVRPTLDLDANGNVQSAAE